MKVYTFLSRPSLHAHLHVCSLKKMQRKKIITIIESIEYNAETRDLLDVSTF